MQMPTAFPEPHDIPHPPDTGPLRHDSANRSGRPGNLTLSIGSLILRCKLEIERVDKLRPASAETQARLTFGNWLRRALPSGASDNPQVSRPGYQSTSLQGRADRSHPGHLRVTPQRDGAPVVFWGALDPIERDAFRAVASSRTFAAGARLIQEGDRADHVIVILSGRTKICIEENGCERVLAERGPGQLVGERGALQVSVRSASVIALETVQALVVRTGDFAAFISAHPMVLKIVESQLYDRLTEHPAGYEPNDFHLSANRPIKRPQVLNGENCTVILSDVTGFGARTRTDEDRRIIREALFSITHAVLQGIPDVWSWDDRGDGLLIVVPPSVPTAKVIAHLHRALPAALDDHNRAYHDSARIQLRVAVNVGPVTSDSMGVSGEAIIVIARLIEAPPFKKAMDASGACLGVIASTFIYETAIRHFRGLTGYSQVQVEVKESSVAAWMKLFGPDRIGPDDFNSAVV